MINMVSLRSFKWQFDSLFIKKKGLITTIPEIIYIMLLFVITVLLTFSNTLKFRFSLDI